MATQENSNTGLFKPISPNEGGFTGEPGGLADFLVPAGPGTVDVINNYTWTLTPPAGRTETPYASLTEYRVLQSALMNSARYYLTGIKQKGEDQLGAETTQNETADVGSGANKYLGLCRGYDGLFDFKYPTGFSYTVPYFNDVANEVNSTWTTLDILEKIKGGLNTLAPGVGDKAGLVADAVMLAYEAKYPRVGIMDRPKLWESSGFRSINIKIPLFNTLSIEDIQKNWELCYLLTYQNMFNKKDFITAVPPVFYTVRIPGQFFSLAMYVSDLKIYNRGNMRTYTLKTQAGNSAKIIPDVYEIDMTLTDMIMPSQNMLTIANTNEPVDVKQINTFVKNIDNLGGAVEATVEGGKKLVEEGKKLLKE